MINNAAIEAVSEWGDRELVWGKTDCCQFADFVVEKLTGHRYIHWSYTSELGAAKILVEHGGLAGAVTHAMEREPVEPADLKIGAVTEIDCEGPNALGIYVGYGVVSAIGPDGAQVVYPIGDAVRGWNI